MGNHLLCGLAAVQIPYDSAAQDVAQAYDQALHGAQNPQVLYAGGQQAQQRGQHQHDQPDEQWLAPSPGVGEHAMPQAHEGIGYKEQRDGLLYGGGGGAQILLDGRERGKQHVRPQGFSVPMLPSNSIACREVRRAKGCALLGVDGEGMGVSTWAC